MHSRIVQPCRIQPRNEKSIDFQQRKDWFKTEPMQTPPQQPKGRSVQPTCGLPELRLQEILISWQQWMQIGVLHQDW